MTQQEVADQSQRHPAHGRLNLNEWLICIVATLTIMVASEVRELIRRRRPAAIEAEPATVTAGAST